MGIESSAWPAAASTTIFAVLEAVVIVLLVVFTLRRFLLIGAALFNTRLNCADAGFSMTVIVAARNEENNLPQLLQALGELKYPSEMIHFVTVNDASLDSTGRILQAWAATRNNARHLEIAERVGKAQALNLALRAAPESCLVAVYDADLIPHPDSLGILAGVFHDRRVAAAAGYRKPTNVTRSPSAAYAALESYVHQLVTQSGKERLGLNPTTLGGNCVYRRSALEELGGFPAGSYSEDIEISLGLVSSGWRTRFCRHAVAGSRLVESLHRYWNQRSRWTRGLYHSRTRASKKVEGWLVSAGYLDRIVLLAAVALTVSGHMRFEWPALFLLAPLAAVSVALYRARTTMKETLCILLWSVPMFLVDVAVSLAATIHWLVGSRLEWKTGRA